MACRLDFRSLGTLSYTLSHFGCFVKDNHMRISFFDTHVHRALENQPTARQGGEIFAFLKALS
jgi:hypothetical protein